MLSISRRERAQRCTVCTVIDHFEALQLHNLYPIVISSSRLLTNTVRDKINAIKRLLVSSSKIRFVQTEVNYLTHFPQLASIDCQITSDYKIDYWPLKTLHTTQSVTQKHVLYIQMML